ncbi:MAG: hypothetical protein WC873_04520 [Candidatus Gracilibacteria bacterium]
MKKSAKIWLGGLVLVVVLVFGFLSTDFGQASIFRRSPILTNLTPAGGTVVNVADNTEFTWSWNPRGNTLIGGFQICFEKNNSYAIFCSDLTGNQQMDIADIFLAPPQPGGWGPVMHSLYGDDINIPAQADLEWFVNAFYIKRPHGPSFTVKSKVWPITVKTNTVKTN